MAILSTARRDGVVTRPDARVDRMIRDALRREEGYSPPDAPRIEVVDVRTGETGKELEDTGGQRVEDDVGASSAAGIDVDLLGDVEVRDEGAVRVVEAVVSIVRTGDRKVLGTGTGSARGPVVREAKTIAVRDAVREALRGFRAATPATPAEQGNRP
jgi:hypothetical protein